MFSYLSNMPTFTQVVMGGPEDPGDLSPCFIITSQLQFWNLTALGNPTYACVLRFPVYHLRTLKIYAPPLFLFIHSTRP